MASSADQEAPAKPWWQPLDRYPVKEKLIALLNNKSRDRERYGNHRFEVRVCGNFPQQHAMLFLMDLPE